MKRMGFFTLLSLLVSAACTVVLGQTPEPQYYPSERPMQKMDMIKVRMKEEIKLSDAKADSVAAIELDFHAKTKQIMADATITEEDKKTKLKTLGEQRKKRWKAASLSDEEIKKVETFYLNRQKAIQQRGGQ
ncbi:hypothetical protein [Parasediminibacterium sp. JCM 36343]|uniref:hypothetical protein n=1 Tax=Parasediminibacterium sp. JCM 36343 TaxID=3374279 RepID=UPI00397CBBDC